MMNIAYLVTFLFILVDTSEQFDLETCRSPLGIETGKISDSAFSASSYAGANAIPSNARIRSENDGWCPASKISSDSHEYLQIDFDKLMVITLVELQGKHSLKPNEQFADAFRLEYRRNETASWISYKDFAGQNILSGNTNSYIPSMRDILPALIARQIRLIPIVTGSQAKHICLRLEFYGCIYQDAPISYEIPQGDQRGYDIHFFDETYDGSNENGFLKDGLGQLTDGIVARDDYLLGDNVQGIGQLGYDWIGWRRKPSMNSTITLRFHFENQRHWSSIHLHTSNLFTRDIYQFHSITIQPCHTTNQTLHVNIPEDRTNIQARFINISFPLTSPIIGSCLQIRLTYHPRSKWILISEILFKSTPIDINSILTPSLTTTTTTTVVKMDDDESSSTSLNNDFNWAQYWHWIVLAFSLLMILVLLLIFVYLQLIQTTRQKRNLRKMTNHMKFESNYQPIAMKFPFKSRIKCCYVPTSSSSTTYDHSSCSISNNDIRHHLIVSTNTSTTSPSTSRGTNGSEFGTISSASPATVSTVYQSVINPYLTAVSQDSPNVTSNPYASIDMYTNPLNPSIPIELTDHHVFLDNYQGPCGNCTFQSWNDDPEIDRTTIPRINDEQLIIEEKYSGVDGCFGTIVRGYIYLREPFDILKPILIKALTSEDSREKDLFDREHQLWSRLTHPNLVQFFGYSLKDDYALIEHSNLGDLYSYLHTSHCLQPNQPSLSMNIRLLIVTQICNALRYLESEKIVHRDIAARNCLIYPNYEIKLTNSALASSDFHTQYFVIDKTCRVPIRWMAPETLSKCEFSSQSDIWAFGITLWEVMTHCASLPYSLLSDEQVYQRLKLMGTNLVRSSGSLQLSKPECLSKELVDLMLECWRPFGERPSFHEIAHFFNKRLHGIQNLA